MEDIVFQPFLSALISIYTVRIMIPWCKSSSKKSRTQGGFLKFGVLILQRLLLSMEEISQTCKILGIIN